VELDIFELHKKTMSFSTSSLLRALPTFPSTGLEGVREEVGAGAVFVGSHYDGADGKGRWV
jgi:hypothetical protein